MSRPDFRRLAAWVADRLQVARWGAHGFPHLGRVAENGRRFARLDAEVDADVVEAFALLHDAGRSSELEEDGHAEAGAKMADEARALGLVALSPAQWAELRAAILGHTAGEGGGASRTMLACWDADALDLRRFAPLGCTCDVSRLRHPAAREVARLTALAVFRRPAVPFSDWHIPHPRTGYLYHYTPAATLPAILGFGALEPRVCHGFEEVERPAVYCTMNAFEEPGLSHHEVSGRMTFMAANPGAVARIKLQHTAAPITWEKHQRQGFHGGAPSPVIHATQLVLQTATGASPEDWRLSYDPIPASAFLAVEVFAGGWRPWRSG